VEAMRKALDDHFDALRARIDQLDVADEARHALRRDLEAAREPVLALRGLRGMRSLACFVSSEAGVLHAYALPWPVQTACFFEDHFELWPLEQMLSQAERYAICLVDADDARLFLYFMDRIEQVAEIHHVETNEHRYPQAQQHLLAREAAELWQQIQDTPPQGRGIGPEEVFALLWQRRAKAVLLDPNIVQEARRCQQCGRLVLPNRSDCPECGGLLAAVPDAF